MAGTLSAMMLSTVPVMADTVQESQIVKGTENLIQDVTTWLMVLAPIVGVLLIKKEEQFLLEIAERAWSILLLKF